MERVPPRSITHDEYDTMVVDLKRKETDLLGQLQGHSMADEAFLISSSYVLELASRAEELFEKSQAKQQNEFLRFVLANASVEGGKLVYKLKNPFAGIVLCNEAGNWLPLLYSLRTEWFEEIRELGNELRSLTWFKKPCY